MYHITSEHHNSSEQWFRKIWKKNLKNQGSATDIKQLQRLDTALSYEIVKTLHVNGVYRSKSLSLR